MLHHPQQHSVRPSPGPPRRGRRAMERYSVIRFVTSARRHSSQASEICHRWASVYMHASATSPSLDTSDLLPVSAGIGLDQATAAGSPHRSSSVDHRLLNDTRGVSFPGRGGAGITGQSPRLSTWVLTCVPSCSNPPPLSRRSPVTTAFLARCRGGAKGGGQVE